MPPSRRTQSNSFRVEVRQESTKEHQQPALRSGATDLFGDEAVETGLWDATDHAQVPRSGNGTLINSLLVSAKIIVTRKRKLYRAPSGARSTVDSKIASCGLIR